jgi:hypothetical protein
MMMRGDSKLSQSMSFVIEDNLALVGIGLTIAAIIDDDREYLEIQLKRFNLEIMDRRSSNKLLRVLLEPALLYDRYVITRMIITRWQQSNIRESQFPILTQLFVEPDITDEILYQMVRIYPDYSFTEHAMALINDQDSYENLIAFRRLIKIFPKQGYAIYKTLIDYIFSAQNLNSGFANDLLREEVIVQLKATSSFAERPDWIITMPKVPKINVWSLLGGSEVSPYISIPIECLLYENAKTIATPQTMIQTEVDKNKPEIKQDEYKSPPMIGLSPLESRVDLYHFTPPRVNKSLQTLSPRALLPNPVTETSVGVVNEIKNRSPMSPKSTTSSIRSPMSPKSTTSSIRSPTSPKSTTSSIRSPTSPKSTTSSIGSLISTSPINSEKTPPRTVLSSFIPSENMVKTPLLVNPEINSITVIKPNKDTLYYNILPTELAIKVLSTNYNSMSDITRGGYDEVANELRDKYSIATMEEKIQMLKPYYQLQAAQRDFYDPLITQVKGPANIGFGWSLEDLHTDKAYMFLCNDYRSMRDYERDTDDSLIDDILGLETQNNPEGWFTGNCESCFRKIFKTIYAVRRPRINGGWDGCYCSWSCVRNDVVEPNYIQEQLISHFEDWIYSNGVLENQITNPKGSLNKELKMIDRRLKI